MNSIKIIDVDAYKIQKMKKAGLGGNRMLATAASGVTYIFKPDYLNQSLNEVLGQNIIRALHLSFVECVWIKRADRYYGGLKYIDGITRIYYGDFKNLNDKQQEEFIKFKLLNGILANADSEGEIFLTSDDKIISLDYGEAGIDVPLCVADVLQEDMKEKYKDMAVAKLRRDYAAGTVGFTLDTIRRETGDFLREEVVKDIALRTFRDIGRLKVSEFSPFLADVSRLFGEYNASLYHCFILKLSETAKEIYRGLACE